VARTLEIVQHDWERGARCRSAAEIFFGPNHFEPKSDRLARETRAKSICMECPALVPCRKASLENEELFGVWGGMTEQERRDHVTARATKRKKAS
jgi:WhiB family redox-sensing transcriptional regulator